MPLFSHGNRTISINVPVTRLNGKAETVMRNTSRGELWQMTVVRTELVSVVHMQRLDAVYKSRTTEIGGLRNVCLLSKPYRRAKILSIEHDQGRKPA